MGVFEIIGGIVLCILAVLIILTVLMQESKANMGSLGGANLDNTSFGRNRGKTMEAMLARATKILSILFFAAVILLAIVEKFAK